MADSWSTLPRHILIKILRYLSTNNSYHAGLSCRSWWHAFCQPQIWRIVEFNFTKGQEDAKFLRALPAYGEHFRNITIRVDQSEKENRLLAVQFLHTLAVAKNGRTKRLRLEFVGTNPLFYGGQEFVDALMRIFESRASNHALEFVDLSRTPVMYTDDLFLTMAASHFDTLKYLNIQTKQFICKIRPECILNLATVCHRLVDLRLCHSSLANQVLMAFANHPSRSPLKHLSILCRRQEKYFHHDITELTWLALLEKCPNLDISLKFDPTCPLEKAREIMKPPMPVRHLFMEMHTNAHEIALAVEYYHRTLRKLVVQARPSPLLESALLDAAEWCRELSSIHIMCLLDRYTVEEILRRRPELAENERNYTLKYEMEPHPWVTDEILDELPIYVQ